MRTLNLCMLALGLLMTSFSAVGLFTSCKAPDAPSQAGAVAAEAAYETELVACEQDASSRAQGAVCRCGVDVRFAVDGGNCR